MGMNIHAHGRYTHAWETWEAYEDGHMVAWVVGFIQHSNLYAQAQRIGRHMSKLVYIHQTIWWW